MQTYKVGGPFITLIAGLVQITAEQARARTHALIAVEQQEDGGGIFEVNGSVTFKRGEIFGHDGEIPKSIACAVDALGNEEAPEKPKRRRRTKAEIAAATAAGATGEAGASDADEDGDGEQDGEGAEDDGEGSDETGAG